MESNYQEIERYRIAQKRVKRIKGFYIHLAVYVIINAIALIANFYELSKDGGNFFSMKVFSMPLFWGIGIVSHGLSVFNGSFLFGKEWEEKKIRELMEKQNDHKWE